MEVQTREWSSLKKDSKYPAYPYRAQVGDYRLLFDLTDDQVAAFKVVSEFCRYDDEEVNMRIIFKEPQITEFGPEKVGSIGWKVSFKKPEVTEMEDELDEAYRREDRIKEIR